MLKAEKVSFFIFLFFFLFILLAKVNYYTFGYLGILNHYLNIITKSLKFYIHKFLTTVPGIFITQNLFITRLGRSSVVGYTPSMYDVPGSISNTKKR